MKILMLTDKMDLGGAETHIFTLSAALAERGHSIYIASSGGALAKKLEHKLSAPHKTLPLGSKNPFGLIFCFFALRRLIKKESIELIHSHARMPSFIASLLSHHAHVPLVCTAHAKFSSVGFRRIFSRWGQQTIAVGEDLKQYLIDRYDLPPENVTVIPNGIDTDVFSPPTSRQDTLTVGFLSRLDADCSLAAELLCKAAPSLCASLGEIEILIGGSGSEYERISTAAGRANEIIGSERVHLLGRIDDTPSFFRQCHIFVGVSRAAIEAACCKAKVILCGNEGYFGILDNESFHSAMRSNFCARGCRTPSERQLFEDVLRLARRESGELRKSVLRELGASEMASATEDVYKKALRIRLDERPEVLLCGYYGYRNIGDDALLRAAIFRSRTSLKGLGVCALTRKGRRDSEKFGIRCIGRYSPIALMAALLRCRYFILGGGTLMQSSTSLRSLVYYSSLLKMAKFFGARCEIWANGIGELSGKCAKRIAVWGLESCEYISLRDLRSIERARSMIFGKEIGFERDLATNIAPSDSQRCEYILERILGKKNGDARFVIGAPKDARGVSQLEGELVRARQSGAEVLVIAMHEGEDRAITEDICARTGARQLRGICYADLVALAKRSEGVYTMRLHALIAAKAAGVKYTVFGEDEKLRAEE